MYLEQENKFSDMQNCFGNKITAEPLFLHAVTCQFMGIN